MKDNDVLTEDPPRRRARLALKLDDGYLPLDELATYSRLSVRLLWTMIKRKVDPLPHYRFGTKIEVRRSEFDEWAAKHHRVAPEAPFDPVAYNDAKIRGRT